VLSVWFYRRARRERREKPRNSVLSDLCGKKQRGDSQQQFTATLPRAGSVGNGSKVFLNRWFVKSHPEMGRKSVNQSGEMRNNRFMC
jgi:hypothetical protein